MNKIDIKNLKINEAYDFHDLLREGTQVELSPFKVSALLKELVLQVNELQGEVIRLGMARDEILPVEGEVKRRGNWKHTPHKKKPTRVYKYKMRELK